MVYWLFLYSIATNVISSALSLCGIWIQLLFGHSYEISNFATNSYRFMELKTQSQSMFADIDLRPLV